MSEDVFLQPRLVGARFENHAIPLEFLKDLAVLDEMVGEVAKWLYLRENPGRKRVPRGFADGISLKLSGIEEGSAVLLISLAVASKLLFAPESQVHFEGARNAVISAIGAAERNTSITNHLPDKALSYFDRFGRSLRDGEAIEFAVPDESSRVRLTRETRRRLVLAASNVNEVTEEIRIHGVIPEVDQSDMTFELELRDGRKICGPLAPQHHEAIIEAFTGYRRGTRIRLQGIGKFNRHNRLEGIESVENITILDSLDVSARLDEFKQLVDGWLSGEGIALDHRELDWLATNFDKLYEDNLPLPHTYPTPEGGVRMEWSVEPKEISLEIDLRRHVGAWHVVNIETDEEDLAKFNLNVEGGWKDLADRMRVTAGEPA